MKKYLFKNKMLFFLSSTLIISKSILNLFTVVLIKRMVDIISIYDLNKFKRITVISIIVFLIYYFLDYFSNIVVAKLKKQINISIKNDLFSGILKSDYKNVLINGHSRYLSIFNNDLNLIENDYIDSIFLIISSMVNFVLATIYIFKLSFHIAVTIFLLSFILIIIPQFLNKKLSLVKNNFSNYSSLFTRKLNDLLAGFEILKSFNVEKKAQEEFEFINNELELKKYDLAKINSFINTLTSFLGFLLFWSTISLGTFLAIKKVISLGTMIASIQLINYLLNPINYITKSLAQIKSVKPIQKKILDIINTYNNKEYSGIKKLDFKNSIEFKKVEFSYNDNNKKVLKDISFKINKNEKVALVGLSGSGKSTILKLLLNYYDNFSGNIIIDSVDIRNICKPNLYKTISIIHQNVFLFETSIKNNITLFSEYKKETIENIVDICGLRKLIDSLPNGLETIIDENGSNLSGGEKQRIALSRALIKNTPILALDEFNSSLDNETSYKLENEILSIDNLTCITITHKLQKKILNKYDKIIVLKEGEITEIGTFEELIRNKGYFYNLYTVQE